MPHPGLEQVVEEEGAVFGAVGGWDVGSKPAPLLGFLAGHYQPTDGLGLSEDSGLDGFMFAGFHGLPALLILQYGAGRFAQARRLAFQLRLHLENGIENEQTAL